MSGAKSADYHGSWSFLLTHLCWKVSFSFYLCFGRRLRWFWGKRILNKYFFKCDSEALKVFRKYRCHPVHMLVLARDLTVHGISCCFSTLLSVLLSELLWTEIQLRPSATQARSSLFNYISKATIILPKIEKVLKKWKKFKCSWKELHMESKA